MKSSSPLSDVELTARFAPFVERMRAEGLPEIVIQTFGYYYEQLLRGESGLIYESDITPVEQLPDVETLPASYAEDGRQVLPKTVFMKLNGGLGTSMGLNKAKSLLTVKDDLTFLDIIAHQALACKVPLVLMNSFNTRADTLAALARYSGLSGDLPLDFVQHKVPKIQQADLTPARWPADPTLEWAPPGHGDIYTALYTSGMLDLLLAAGKEYVFVSNADNLGAVLDTTLLGYFAIHELPFLMEVADRTPSDRKGGHLAFLHDDRLVLRESAQCPPEEQKAFQDIRRHRYFNTNNLWLHLPAVKSALEQRSGILGLPLIRNRKTIDPRDPTSTPVYHLETAMGAAISVFEGAGAIRVSRTRFSPVKTTSDLLAVRSDLFILTEDYRVVENPTRCLGPIVIQLDPAYYQLIDQLERRFPHGPPSLIGCQELNIEGNVRFGPNVTLVGCVDLVNNTASPLQIPAGAVIEGSWPA